MSTTLTALWTMLRVIEVISMLYLCDLVEEVHYRRLLRYLEKISALRLSRRRLELITLDFKKTFPDHLAINPEEGKHIPSYTAKVVLSLAAVRT